VRLSNGNDGSVKKSISNLIEYVYRSARGRTIIVLLISTFAIYFTMLLYSIPRVESHAGGMRILDMQPLGYSTEYVWALLDNLGEEGRNTYMFLQIPLDLLFPPLFAITCSLLLAFLFQRGFNTRSKIRIFVLIPMLAGLFDYLENIGIIILLKAYPRFPELVARFTGGFSLLKSIFTSLFFVLLLIGLTAVIYRKISRYSDGIKCI
jgi:hypothetical protein